MQATRGQSLWLNNITGNLLARGTLQKYIDTSSVTGLTSNPTIFDNAISRTNSYDSEIRRGNPSAGRAWTNGRDAALRASLSRISPRRRTCLRSFMSAPRRCHVAKLGTDKIC